VASSRTRRHEPANDIAPTSTTPFTGSLEDGADYESLDFAGLDLGPGSAVGTTFLASRLERCGLDGVRLDRARFVESRVADLVATTIDAADSTWRDSLLADVRVGALLAVGSTWDLVRLRGVKANLLDLRGAHLTDIVFEDCAIGELDLGDAEARGVSFERCAIDDLSVEGARLADVGLSGARLGQVRGVAGLRGATLDAGQVVDLVPVLAAHLGITIKG
jgi:uncharacterized protein YjbI with pentapeptide repeats